MPLQREGLEYTTNKKTENWKIRTKEISKDKEGHKGGDGGRNPVTKEQMNEQRDRRSSETLKRKDDRT